MMTAHATIQTAVDAMRKGAYDFLTKPFEPPEALVHAVVRASERKRLLDRNRFLEKRLGLEDDYYGIVGSAPSMRRLFALIEAVRHASSSVLIRGESGTGKELVARALHHGSPRRQRAFVAVNCSALPDALLESELFGHARGAFTGADRPHEGLFEAADGGTLLLDEIGDMPLALQAKLLRVLQEGEVRRIGESQPRKVDVRIVAATHVDLARAVADGRFREDLYYRLDVISLTMPPLRERREDIPQLAWHFLRRQAARQKRRIEGFSDEALARLTAYGWPGNVRELENAIERAVVLSRTPTIEAEALPDTLRQGGGAGEPVLGQVSALPFQAAKNQAIEAFEARYVREALERTGGNVSEAARLAGLDRSNFRRLARRHPSVYGGGDTP
ncbi:MAG: sigma-54-dependent Fis family transcriptional regulator, partial [Deltaproteobacteria bacterium]|nr:sigma-54-dependent Fis family transcriptional regulator [Deltaproteobacteria bacterium]